MIDLYTITFLAALLSCTFNTQGHVASVQLGLQRKVTSDLPANAAEPSLPISWHTPLLRTSPGFLRRTTTVTEPGRYFMLPPDSVMKFASQKVLSTSPEALCSLRIGLEDGAALMLQAARLGDAGKFEQAAETYNKAASAFEAEGKTEKQAEALSKSAAMYEKQADELLGKKKVARPAAKKDPVVKPDAVAGSAVDGSKLMTPQEIIGYMRSNGYVNGVPRRDPKVAQDLIAQIKRRGVVRRLEYGKDNLDCFGENLANYGVNDVVSASASNLGTPTTLSWLSGKWTMYVIGGVVDTAPGDGYIHRRNESIGKLGFLSISLNGTYTWKVGPSDPPAKYIKGSWRKATSAEMGLQGGAGIVLQKAAEGADWIVFKYMDSFKKTERVEVEHMQYRGAYRRIGWRE